jgi:hypothetical protein
VTKPSRPKVIGIATIAVLIGVIAVLIGRAEVGGSGGPGAAATATAIARNAHAIADENAKPGDADWRIDRPSLNGEIEAYAGQVSVQPGETLDVYVSTKAAGAKFDADVYRMGWYGGAGARNVRSIKNVDGDDQGRWDPLHGLQDCKTCKVDPATLLVQANWKRSLQVKIPSDWASGYYLVRLHERKTDTATYVIFIVRDDASHAAIVVQASTNTWQAYNTWGDASFYGSFGANRKYVAKTRRAYRVSYDRPYDPMMRDERNDGAGEFFSWEYNFVRWAESQGYDMTYTTSVDVSLRGDTLQRHRMVISLGHDEYWTKQQRDAFEAARDAGTNIAFFGGNEAYWQARLDASPAGTPGRILTEYKDAALDPLARSNPKEATVLFADPPVSRPQSQLSGLAYGSNTQPDYMAWRPANLDTWIFAGSGIVDGQSFPGIVGYEYDHIAAPAERPPGLVVVGSSPVNGFLGSDTAASALYTAPSGAEVFAAGTVAWAWGLDDFGHEERGAFADDRLRRVTKNIMDRMSARRSATAP